MREFIRDRFPEFEATAHASDEPLSAAQLAERRMAERDALLAKLGSGALSGADLPQLEFVKENIVDKALASRASDAPRSAASASASASVDEPAIWFEVSEQERARARAAKQQAEQLKRMAEREAELARRDAAEQLLAEQQLAELREQEAKRQLERPPVVAAPPPPPPPPPVVVPAPPRAAFKQPLSRAKRAAAAAEAAESVNDVDDDASDADAPPARQHKPAASPIDAFVRLIESGDVAKLSMALGAVSLALLVFVAVLVFVWRVVLAESVLFPVLLLLVLALVALLASQFAAQRQGVAEPRYVAESLLALRGAAAIAALLFVRSLRVYALSAAVSLAVALFALAQRPRQPAVLGAPPGADPVVFGAVVVALVALVFQLVAGGDSAAAPAPQPVPTVERAPPTPVKLASPVKVETPPSSSTGLKKRGGASASSTPIKADDEDLHAAQAAGADEKKHK
jgi:hypothetical protein